MARALAGLVLFSSSLSACYLSHGRAPTAADAGGRDTPVVALDVRSDAPDVSAGPCRWAALPAWQVTSPPGDQRHNALTATPTGYLVGYASSNDPPVPPGRFVVRVGLEARLAEPVVVFGPTRGPFIGGVGLGLGSESVLAVTYDGTGCRSRALSFEGVPIGGDVDLMRSTCVAPYAVGDRFALFDRPGDAPARIALLDEFATRVVEQSAVLESLEAATWWARARFDDGSMLLIGMRDGVEPTRAVAQHVTARGEPLAAPVPLPAFAAASRVRAAPTERGALVGWLEAPDGDPTSQERELRLFPVDRDGVPLAAPVTVSVLPAYRDGGLSLVRVGADVWASYVESEPGDRFGHFTQVVALRLSAAGSVLERFMVAEGEFLRGPLLSAHDADALVVFSASAGAATQVFAAGLRCER